MIEQQSNTPRNTKLFFLSLIIMATLWGCNQKTTIDSQSVNALIGDESFIQKFGRKPDPTTDNTLRIQTHLEYVERLLSSKDVSGLPDVLQKQRRHLLSLLHQYRTAGIFPKNYDYAERKPCFIDQDGNICAVGYLIEQTAGRPAAEAINRKFKYDKILAMNDVGIDRWVANSGLTKEECAMIQPQYGGIPGMPTPPSVVYKPRITPFIGISSAIIGLGNLSLSAVNIRQALRKTDNQTLPLVSLVTGAGQVVLGAEMLSDKPKEMGGIGPLGDDRASTPKQERNYRSLSKAHIVVGSVTMISSVWNLLANRPSKIQRNSWNISSFETHDRYAAVAINFTRTF